VNDKKLMRALIPLIRGALSGNRQIAQRESAMQFSFRGVGGLTLSHDEAKKLREAVVLFRKTFPKVSEKTCANELRRFCCNFLSEVEATGSVQAVTIAHAAPTLIRRLKSFQKDSTTVYVEVCGIDLGVRQWKFGPTLFMRGDHSQIEKDRLTVTSADGTQSPPLRKTQILVCMQVQGESEFAVEYVAERVQEVLDVLQFLSLPENPGSWDGNALTCALYCCEPIPIISSPIWLLTSRGPTWDEQRTGPPVNVTGPYKCVLNGKTRARFNKRGGLQLSTLLKETWPSAFDQNLLVGITWLASAIRERNLARKYVGFYVALETLFGRDKKGLRESEGYQKTILPLPDAIAFFLANKSEQRRIIAQKIQELSRTRNRVMHRGFTAIDRSDLIKVGTYAWNCCWRAATKRKKFREEDSFSEWLLNRKYGAEVKQ
jgi:hypothetical protein